METWCLREARHHFSTSVLALVGLQGLGLHDRVARKAPAGDLQELRAPIGLLGGLVRRCRQQALNLVLQQLDLQPPSLLVGGGCRLHRRSLQQGHAPQQSLDHGLPVHRPSGDLGFGLLLRIRHVLSHVEPGDARRSRSVLVLVAVRVARRLDDVIRLLLTGALAHRAHGPQRQAHSCSQSGIGVRSRMAPLRAARNPLGQIAVPVRLEQALQIDGAAEPAPHSHRRRLQQVRVLLDEALVRALLLATAKALRSGLVLQPTHHPG
mmetsp:Transcript_91893/g.233673  ORF Transcript_91893/g.233673 Transcript_91893/m.233673 type:complete len:265 (-) Transcript_91893:140-934(-)